MRIGLDAEILTQVKTKFHDRVDNVQEIRRFLRTVEQNEQIPIRILMVVSPGTRAIEQQLGIFRKNTPAKLLDLEKNVGGKATMASRSFFRQSLTCVIFHVKGSVIF